MDLRQLTYFLRVAERKSISAAAAELNVAQPTLTKSVRLLEEELGTPLFNRLPRGVELTAAGQHLVRHAEFIKIQMREAREELLALQKGDNGIVTIGAGPAWLRKHLPVAVANCISTRPDLKIKIVGGFDEALLRRLRQGEVDFVVAETPWSQNANDLDIEIVSSVGLKVISREGHPLATKERISAIDLLQYPWVLPARETRARQRLDAQFMSMNLSPPAPAVETESMAFMLAMIRASDTLTYTSTATLLPPDGAGLIVLPVDVLASDRAAAIIRRKSSWVSPAAKLIIDQLRLVCEADPNN